MWAVGFAYADHRTEVGYSTTVDDPMIFLKAPSSVTATESLIVLPTVAPQKVDYEGELGVVIGSRATAVTPEEAMSYVAGYTICNDVSARDVQKGLLPGRAADVSAAKSFDTFTPMGPWLTTLDDLDDPHDLRLRTWVDGELRQDARTSKMIYPIPTLISYLSRQTTLEASDVILTGTPAGVGHKQGKFLRAGTTVEIEIEGLGRLTNTCG
jgi:2-keto-4-pentenoate hydratase/2-oxohepta-3-ene-1,7-dioic acid hydratase in catechol pathway